jgi:hypothetical protein
MDEAAMQAALDRIAAMRESRPGPAELEAALARARRQIEALAATTHVMQVGMPGAIQDGLREHFRPTTRHIAEIRGLMNHAIGRLERLENELLAERNARVDDLALLVELISSGWRAANDRLERIEASVGPQGATVYRLEAPTQQAS